MLSLSHSMVFLIIVTENYHDRSEIEEKMKIRLTIPMENKTIVEKNHVLP